MTSLPQTASIPDGESLSEVGSQARGQAQAKQGDQFYLATLFVFVLFEILQGPLRYYLASMGGVALAYAPKGLMLLAFSALMVRTLWTLRLSKVTLTAIVAFASSMAVGLYYMHSMAQPLMGAFALMPLLFGVMAEPSLTRIGSRIVPYVFALWLCVAIGVAFNYFHSVPWSGFTYQLGDTDVDASREWSYFGVARVAGFARASYEAAAQLLFLGLISTVTLRSKSLAFGVWVVTGLLIAATTSKTTEGLYFVLTLLFPLVARGIVPVLVRRAVGFLLPFLLALIGVLLPASTLFLRLGSGFANQSSGTLLVSFGMRLAQTWPDTFALVFSKGSVLMGRGIGGTGAAQKIFEPDIYLSTDNVYLYLYATFGIAALAIIYLFALGISRLRFSGNRPALLYWFLGVAILMEGWTVSCIEGGTMAVITGLTVAFVAHQGRRPALRITQ